jgi:hypothetical protein
VKARTNPKALAKSAMIVAVMGAGLATTVASVVGSYSYMLDADGNGSIMMAGGFAGGLGMAIYLGWEFAFNSKNWKRRVAAALIAASAATVSGYTLYQNAELPEVTAQEQQQAAAAETATQAALKAAQEQEKNAQALRDQIADLQGQNALDKAAAKALQADIDADIEPKANGKKLDALNKGMATRNADINKLLDKLPAPEIGRAHV